MKQFIEDNLLNSIGRLNSRKLSEKWFLKNGYIEQYNSILNKTSFLPEDSSFPLRVNFLLCDIKTLLVCPVCGTNHSNHIRNKPSKYCSSRCASKSQEKKDKSKETNNIRYGCDHHNKTDSNRKRLSDTMSKRWENDRESLLNSNANNSTHHLSKETLEILNNKDALLASLKKHNGLVQSLAKELDVYYGTVISRLRKYNLYDTHVNHLSSSPEKEVADFIRSVYDGEVLTGVRGKISGNNKLEVDIFIDGILAIEFNGLYWHTDKYKPKNYHKYKTDNCKTQLFHICESEWKHKKDIWKSVILNKLGKSQRIYARKCEIIEFDKTPMSFLKDNHLQGAIASSVSYGLQYENELMCVMTFGKCRFKNKEDWELLRFCNKKGVSVIGGASRLFKHFLKNNSGTIVSYANKKWSNGGLYRELGFTFVEETQPSYSYTNGHEILSRYKCFKSKLPKMFPLSYSDDKSETEILNENGYFKTWDSGNYKFVYNNNK